MDAFIPTGGAGSTAKVQEATGAAGNAVGSVTATFGSTPTPGNIMVAALIRRGTGSFGLTPTGWTKHDVDVISPAFDGGRIGLYYRTAGVAEPTAHTFTSTDVKRLYIAEWAGLTAPVATSGVGWSEKSNAGSATTMVTDAITPAVTPIVLFAGFVQAARFPTLAIQAPFSEDYDVDVDASGPGAAFGHRIVDPASGSYTATCTSSHAKGYGAFLAAFSAGAGGITWVAAPDTVDESDASSDDVEAAAIAATSGAFWRGDYGSVASIGELRAVLGFEDAGDVSVLVQGGDAADWSDAATIVTVPFDATGGFAPDELDIVWDATAHRYWRLVLDTAAQGIEVFEVTFGESAVIEPQEPGRAILEIYVHDEDASRWGTATWATGPATGTEGIWSAAGWTDITPEGVTAHVIWGSRRPSRGILHQQDAASWNVETYDPDRDLDPGNMNSPYWPQLVAGLPIRISHESTVIRTGYVDEMTFKHKPPYYQGQILATDTIALLHKASVPADSTLSDTLHARIIDAIVASGIAVGGIPLPPPDFGGPTLSDWVEGAATDDPTSVWEVIQRACEEVLWVPYINHDASLGLRSWGAPLNRGREISAPNLEDLTSLINEDGVYSVVRVQPADPMADVIEREAAPLPRYGRRVYERSEPTINPDDWAAAVLAERSWPGVQYVPGTVHCFTAADVDYFGSLQIMERIQVTVPGAVSVSGRLLGGELWVEHRGNERASWMFNFAVATDGSTAIGLDTLVSDQGGDFLIDDQTDTDFLEAD